MVGGSRVRFHVRVLSLGFWSVLFGGVLLYATSRALSVVARASASGATTENAPAATSAEPWLAGVLHGGLRAVLQFGAVSVAVGVALAVLGAWLLRSTTRAAPR